MRILIGFIAAACIGYGSYTSAAETSEKQVIRSEADILVLPFNCKISQVSNGA